MLLKGEKVFPVKLLKYWGFKADNSNDDEELTATKMLEEHLKECITENALEHVDTDRATKGAQNIELLSKSMEHLKKAEAEQLKVKLQLAEAQRRQWVNWDIVLPKLVAIGVTGIVTVFWLCLEQGTPVPMRLVKMATDLTVPRGL